MNKKGFIELYGVKADCNEILEDGARGPTAFPHRQIKGKGYWFLVLLIYIVPSSRCCCTPVTGITRLGYKENTYNAPVMSANNCSNASQQ